MTSQPQLDEIGYWSELKLEIIDKYARAYSIIFAKQPRLRHLYIDAFAGAGLHVTKMTNEFVPGSPLNALNVSPPFREHHLIDIDSAKTENLRRLIGDRKDVFIYQGDCNKILLSEVFPRARYEDFRRGLCILDPYGLHLDWTVIFKAGQMKTIDMFLNFPIADMNRNVLRRDPEGVNDRQKARMTAYWGDESWREHAYRTDTTLFEIPEKQSNEVIVAAFCKRLKTVAGFARVPKPLAMRNSVGAVVYYLFFASQKDTAEHIVLDIFEKYSARGVR